MQRLRMRLQRLSTHPALDGPRRGLKRLNDALAQAALKRRRARASKRRATNRKLLYGLIVSFIGLLGLFVWALTYMEPRTPGNELTIDQLSDLADDGRLVTAEFRDEDAIVTGAYSSIWVTSVDPRSASITTRSGSSPTIASTLGSPRSPTSVTPPASGAALTQVP